MMKEEDNVQILRDAYAAFTRGDIPAVMKAFASDIEWHTPGLKEAPYVGRRRGTSEVGRFFVQVGETVEFTAFEPREYIAQGDRVVVLGTTPGGSRPLAGPSTRTGRWRGRCAHYAVGADGPGRLADRARGHPRGDGVHGG
jgi:ketosteroid isomerase-like protein